jgi:hypothetical protein
MYENAILKLGRAQFFAQTFLMMSIMAIPALILNNAGVAYTSKKISPSGLLRTTVGNIGDTEDGTDPVSFALL